MAGGFYTLFDGAGVTLKQPGSFVLHKTSEMEIQVSQVPCGGMSLCITAVGIKFRTDRVVMLMQGSEMQFYINDQLRIVQYDIEINSDYHCARPNNIKYIFTGPDNDFSLEIDKFDQYMNLYLKTSDCSGAVGLCGTCGSAGSCDENDYSCIIQNRGVINAMSNDIGQEELTDHFETLKPDSSDDILAGYVSSNKAGYALYLDGTDGAASTPFIEDCLSTEDGWITIELTLKIEQAEGVLLSYALEKTFAVILSEGKVSLQYGSELMGTTFTLEVNAWNTFTLMYELNTGSYMLHSIDSEGALKYVSGTFLPDIFPSGGTLSLGMWQIALSRDGIPPFRMFKGYIDRLVLWRRQFGPADIFRHSPYYLLNTEPYLGVMWNFDEGYGKYAYDKIFNIKMRLPENPWYVSTAGITRGDVAQDIAGEALFNNENFRSTAEDECEALLNTGALNHECKTYTTAKEFHYIQCISSVGESGRISSAIDSVIYMSNQCEDREDAPASDNQLCNEFPDRHYVNVYGDNCDQQCVYGKFDHYGSRTCVCDDEYWGEFCEKTCLVDIHGNICSNHGDCNKQTGDCICEWNWKGDHICGSCTEGMTGGDCNIMELSMPTDPSKSQCSYADSVVYNLENAAYPVSTTIEGTKSYTLFQAGFLTVVVREQLTVTMVSS